MKFICSATVLGVLLAFLGLAGGVGIDAVIQQLLQRYGFFQIMFLNNFFALGFVGIWGVLLVSYRRFIKSSPDVKKMKKTKNAKKHAPTVQHGNRDTSNAANGSLEWLPKRWTPHILLGGMGVAGELLFFWGIREHSLAENYTLALGTPLLVVFLAVRFYGEKMSLLKGCCIVTGLGASLVALSPDLTYFSPPLIGVFAMVILNAWSYIIIKYHAQDEGTLALLWTSRSVCVVGALLFLIFQGWTPMQGNDGILFIINGFGYCVVFIMLVTAVRLAKVSTVSFMEYSQLLFGMLLDYILYTLYPSLVTFICGGLIIGAGVLILLQDTEDTEGTAAQATELT